LGEALPLQYPTADSRLLKLLSLLLLLLLLLLEKLLLLLLLLLHESPHDLVRVLAPSWVRRVRCEVVAHVLLHVRREALVDLHVDSMRGRLRRRLWLRLWLRVVLLGYMTDVRLGLDRLGLGWVRWLGSKLLRRRLGLGMRMSLRLRMRLWLWLWLRLRLWLSDVEGICTVLRLRLRLGWRLRLRHRRRLGLLVRLTCLRRLGGLCVEPLVLRLLRDPAREDVAHRLRHVRLGRRGETLLGGELESGVVHVRVDARVALHPLAEALAEDGHLRLRLRRPSRVAHDHGRI
jgi:hypothetical protein